ncbi:MAG: serine/threonine protein kinase [Gloeomargarita sp. SKYG116]|nr:serine/threonine protein kinase [Gloeomargarita sp. SKYG116]MCS7226242.1 serine/threonine protein kinase [Gloeomargarita sp. SKYB31]MDW8400588.1 serine/threonine-protein kinase [Gloeomargarita sp. SKYGB_i_bin116]
MRPPLATHTVLQNRYRIVRVLGQGGFGRTYLAQDLNRFNEYCVLKEFVPARGEPHQIEKAKELFKREAAVLYQLRHPQIPQFHALFEQEQRLFLVQDYVEGKNYRTLLAERLRRGQTFTEAEVRDLLCKVLPVLDYIHSRGVIHRDISPDNLMLRQKDQMPVLIDFGVVKDIASRLQASGATSVGKLGYAPSEQLQTGRVYPASDLYTLAVTVLVLLTGCEPQELYDDRTLTWRWQERVSLSPHFTQVLQKMLSHRPGDRYQSAKEVLQALGETPATNVTSPELPPVNTGPTVVARPVSPPPAVAPVVYSARPMVTAPKPSAWESPIVLALVSVVLVLGTGTLSWFVVSWLMQRPPATPPVWDQPAATPTPSPSPTTGPSPPPLQFNLSLQTGTETQLEQTLAPGQTHTYIFSLAKPQQLRISFAGEHLSSVLLTPDQRSLPLAATWQEPLTAGIYRLQVTNPTDRPRPYRLSLLLSELPPPAPTLEDIPITLAEGATQTKVTTRVTPTQGKRFLFTAPPDQGLLVELQSSGMATLTCRTPDGRIIAAQTLYCTAQPTMSGTYSFDVTSTDATTVTLILQLQPPAGS